MEQTFGSFVREKRQSIGLSLRTLAAKLDLSPVYLSNIENDRRPAPTRAYLERLEQELHLSKVETEQMLDLAAKSQNMVAYNRSSHEGSVTYYGTVGNQYRGIVTVYAKDANGEDSRDITTYAVRAKK